MDNIIGLLLPTLTANVHLCLEFTRLWYVSISVSLLLKLIYKESEPKESESIDQS